MTKIKAFIKRNIPTPALVLFAVFLLMLLIKGVASLSVGFADFFNRYISAVFRALLAYLTALLPFSLAETVILCALPVAVIYLVWCVTVAAKKSKLTRQVFVLLALLCYLGSSFFLTYGIGYNASPLEEKMELDVHDLSVEELTVACVETITELRALEPQITRAANGTAKLPWSFSEMIGKLNDAYDTLYEQYDFLSPLHAPVKQIALSEPLTYTHMSGFYTFWSGEANVNVNYPDFINVYTAAHEMAHQRGIAPEDEANFVAFLACDASDDPYIRYCGYANLLEYLMDAMYRADVTRYRALVGAYPEGLRAEYIAYSEMFDKYRDSKASEVADTVNDAYLKAQGQTEGSRSYGLVVDLAAAYLAKRSAGN